MTIVLVHLGTNRVSYLKDCIKQIRAFNSCKIILAVDSDFDFYAETFKGIVDVELVDPILYKEFTNASLMPDGFWKKCSQRYFALSQIADRHDLHHFFHMENDIMLYQDIGIILELFKELYANAIGATFDNHDRGIPGFMYFDNPYCARLLCNSMMENLNCNDMQALRRLQAKYPSNIKALPIAPGGFCHDPEYSQNFDRFGCVFDAAYLGQHISGTDQGHPPGFVNTDCVINVTAFNHSWKKNDAGLLQPFVNDILVNNLHIHKKDLFKWSSIKHIPLRVDRPHSLPFISNHTFRAFANHIYDETSRSIDTDNVKTGDVIYLKTDYMEEYFAAVNPLIKMKYILITHSSDYSAPGKYISELNKHTNIFMWFCENYDGTELGHPRIRPIPIGIASQEWQHGSVENFNQVLKDSDDGPKAIDLYANFNLNTNYSVRVEALRAIRDIQSDKRIRVEICTDTIPHIDYVMKLSQSRYVASPEGNGLDCHRTWEAAMMGAIPIVTKGSIVDSGLFSGMPVMTIDSWDALKIEDMVDFYNLHLTDLQCLKEKSSGEYWLHQIALTRESLLSN